MKQIDIARAISGHKFSEAYDSFDETMTWEVIGDKVLVGKDAVVAECEKSAGYLASVTTNFRKMEVIVAENSVVIESEAAYLDHAETSVVASCDIYRFRGETLVSVTSYNLELPA